MTLRQVDWGMLLPPIMPSLERLRWLDRPGLFSRAALACAVQPNRSKNRYERADQNRCADCWRGSLRTVRRVRARPARHEGAPDRHSRQGRRPVRRALSGKADLRHSRHSFRHRARSHRAAHGADQAVPSDLPSRRDGGEGREDRRPLVPRHHRRRQGVRMQGGGDLRRRRLVPAEASAGAGHRGL